MKYSQEDISTFLLESNAIEQVYGGDLLMDAVSAWQAIEDFDHLTLTDILEVHKRLMKNIRPDIGGYWRNVTVTIGGHIKRFISVQLIEDELKDLLKWMNNSEVQEGQEEELCMLHHVLFERIHPFEDGNGRVGRILYNWERKKHGLPIHIIHEGKEQMEYYKWFK